VAQRIQSNYIILGKIKVPQIGTVLLSIHISLVIALLLVSYEFSLDFINTCIFCLIFLLSTGIHEGAHIIVDQILEKKINRKDNDPEIANEDRQQKTSLHTQHSPNTPSTPIITAHITTIGIWWNRPWRDRYTYLAGPLASLMVAIYILIIHQTSYPGDVLNVEKGFLPMKWERLFDFNTKIGMLFTTNFWLFLSNVLPSPPSDLGFALAYLSKTNSHLDKEEKAEEGDHYISSGQWLLFALVTISIFSGKLTLIFITGFMLFNAFRASIWRICARQAKDTKVITYVVPATELKVFNRSDSIESTLQQLATSHHDFFPIIEKTRISDNSPPDNDQTGIINSRSGLISCSVVGIVDRYNIISAITKGDGALPIATLAVTDIRDISPHESLEKLFEEFQIDDNAVVVVKDDNNFFGLLFPGKIMPILWTESLKDIF
jgi:hypothetical protein